MNSIALFIMGKKGLDCLKAIQSISCDIIKEVIYATDNSVEEDYSNEIVTFCETHQLKYIHRNFFDETNLDKVDYFFAISWRWIINYDNNKLIVFHDSLLPKYRGFNPLVSALINGDEEIGVTAIFANKEFDRGNIIGFESVSITYPIKVELAIEKISICYQKLVLNVINKSKLSSKKQNEKDAIYSLWRDQEDYFIDWNLDAKKIERIINATGFPYGGARTNMENQVIVIEDAKAIEDIEIINRTSGKFIFIESNCPVIVCGSGLLKIEKAYYLENKENVVFKKFRTRLK
ncbi:formyltransferase family protein [Flavobacterium sp.]|uniref:formyltransferase family protein n=1 Tax=Flavobacterium sp. TaxID=239 RepID=UPI003D2C337D